jgi:Protein of unknown function (DUF3150)
MPTTAAQQQDPNAVTRILFSSGTLFHLYVGRWTGNKKMHERDLLLEEIDKETVYLGHKKLLPREAQETLQRLEGEARRFVENRSVQFPIGRNSRFITFRALREVITRLRQFKTDWDAAVNVLLESYPRIQQEQLQRLEQMSQNRAAQELNKVAPYARVEKQQELDAWLESQRKVNRELYPPIEELRSRFAFEWRMYQINVTEGEQAISALDPEEVLAEQNRLRRDLNRWVSDVAVAMHRELGQAAANARRILEENGKLNPKNLRPLFEAFETFNAVNFAGPSQFQGMIESIRMRYLRRTGAGDTDWSLTADTVNSASGEMSTLLGTIAELAVEETAEKAGVRTVRAGSFGRVLDLE